MTLDAQLEAVLFFKAEPVTVAKLADWLQSPLEEIKNGLKILDDKLTDRGLTLIRRDDEVMIGTNPEASPLIDQLLKEELNRDLGRAGLETLTIILYRGPLARADIDYIRGVNSSFILRHLLMRGLIERLPNPKDARSYWYQPTLELYAYLGISGPEELPDFQSAQQQLEQFISQADQENHD